MTIRIRTDRHLVRASHRSVRYVLAELTAPPKPQPKDTGTDSGRPPVNLAFVVDRSGSMSGDKIHLAKQAVEEALARLGPEDRFAIVVYDEQIDVVVPTTKATADARRDAVDRLSKIDGRGSTDLAGGWLRGCEQVALALEADGVNRCLLLTDGLANVGITDRDALTTHAVELRARGVSTSTFGVGDDFDEALLQSMASAGGGHFYFIADAASIRDHITSEVGEALDIVARAVSLEVAAPAGVVVDSLSPYPTRVRPSGTEILVGDLVSEEQIRVVLKFAFPYGKPGERMGVALSVVDRDGVLGQDGGKLHWEYADDRANDEQGRDREVDRAVASLYAARARQEAVRLNREGDYEGARRALRAVARKIAGYAGHDAELRRIRDELEREAEEMAAPMPELARKRAFALASYASYSRAPSGQAMRAPTPPKS